MSMNRRSFLSLLSCLPFVGKRFRKPDLIAISTVNPVPADVLPLYQVTPRPDLGVRMLPDGGMVIPAEFTQVIGKQSDSEVKFTLYPYDRGTRC